MRAKKCREHAQECEELARRAKDRLAADTYTEIARGWRELAAQLERLKRSPANRDRPNEL
jgi:hypothetical protein